MAYKKFMMERIKTIREWINADKESVDFAMRNLKWAKGHLKTTKDALAINQGRLEKLMAQFQEEFPDVDILEALATFVPDKSDVSIVEQETGVYSNSPDNDQRDWE